MDIKRSLKNNKIFLIAIFAIIVFLFQYSNVYAASLYIKPSQTEVAEGNIINVQVTVDTSGKFINNAESVIQYPTDLLEVVSLDSKSSIFSLWVEDPSYSNNIGQITFNGGVPNPGFSGSSGKIISIIFKTKKAGVASVVFSNSAVRENDGLGTDILTTKTGSNINILAVTETAIPKPTPIETNSSQNLAPVVVSSTHPKQTEWYSKGDVDLSWTLPNNAKTVKTLLGSFPNSEPSVYYSKPITEKNIKNLDDGILYFHVNYLVDETWSKTTHFKIQIDTVDPRDLSVNVLKDDDGKVTLEMKATDALSGIDHYKLVVDQDEPINVKADSSGEASTVVPFTSAGSHKIVVTAYDRAGNSTETQVSVTTDFVYTLSIDKYPSKVKINDSIEVSGTAPYPNASLSVSLMKNDNVVENYKIKSDSYSRFQFISHPVKESGEYKLWVEVLKNDGSISMSSDKVTISVEKPLLLQVGSYTTELLSVLVPGIGLLVLLLFITYYGWHRFFVLRGHMKKNLKQVEEKTHQAFKILSEEISAHLEVLDRTKGVRKLTKKEEEAIDELKNAVAQMDQYIEKQIEKASEK